MRNVVFENGEYYHVYNRGIDKRDVFVDKYDFLRFLKSMKEFNTTLPIGSLHENHFKDLGVQLPSENGERLVEFVAYCLNPNHYHFILKQLVDSGISKFMQKIGTGYTNYFNEKNKRSGALFQGRFKAVLIDSNEYLLYLSAYVNKNNHIHHLGVELPSESREWMYSSELDYLGKRNGNMCKKEIILDQFNNTYEYEKFMNKVESYSKDRKNIDMQEYFLE